MASNYKNPPPFTEESSYERWKKEIQLWQTFTPLQPEKMAPAIALTLTGRARESVLDLTVPALNSAEGVDALLLKMDTLYLKDRKLRIYNAYDKFDRFKRKQKCTINDYLIDFEKNLSKIKEFDINLPDEVLAYRVMNSANIEEEKKQLTLATVSALTYDEVRGKIKSIFEVTGSDPDGSGVKVKEEEEEVYYGKDQSVRKRTNEKRQPGGKSKSVSFGKNKSSMRRVNPKNKDG